MGNDIYFKKIVKFHAWKQELEYKVSQALFSSYDIDLGTKFLLRSIVEAGYKKPETILDLGCGYGPLGITLKSLFVDSTVHMVDIDAVSVEYSRQNLELNGFSDVEVYASLGYDDIERNDFNLIVSNVPAKAGEPVIGYFLKEAAYYLAPEGVAAVVVVTPLESYVENVLNNTPNIEIVLKRTRHGHTVFHYRFSGELLSPRPIKSAFKRGIYEKAALNFRINTLEFPMRIAFNLPESDLLDGSSKLIADELFKIRKAQFRNTVVFNPNQGHLGVMIWKLFHPDKIVLVDRDLLALRNSESNLVLNECQNETISIFHEIDMNLKDISGVDLFVIPLREENREANLTIVKQATGKLSGQGLVVVAGSSTGISRLCADIEPLKILTVKTRDRWRGSSILALRHM